MEKTDELDRERMKMWVSQWKKKAILSEDSSHKIELWKRQRSTDRLSIQSVATLQLQKV